MKRQLGRNTPYTQDEFVAFARQVHGNKYDYSMVEYKNMKTNVCIGCKEHGSFYIKPTNHLYGEGCYLCGRKKIESARRLTKEEFILRSKKIHCNKYDYSKVVYTNNTTKVIIICPIHGEFYQTPKNHLKGRGCHKCGNYEKGTIATFIKRANKVHNGKYDYSQSIYVNSMTKMVIICPKHGCFEQIPSSHLSGHGCPKCKDEKTKERSSLTNKDFIRKATKVHNGKYGYEKANYKKSDECVCITCPTHGDFWQNAGNHLNGSGCPHCKKSFGEMKVREFLTKNHIKYVEQYQFRNENLFCQNKIIKVDFYLPDYNIIIEYQGIQHYMPVKRFGGAIAFEQQKERDNSVRMYCNEHSVDLLEIPHTRKNDIETILKKKLKIK